MKNKKPEVWMVISAALILLLLIIGLSGNWSMGFGITGMLGIIAFLVFLIISAVKKKAKKPFVLGIVICFALFVTGLSIPSGASPAAASPEPSEPVSSTVLSSTKPTSSKTESLNPVSSKPVSSAKPVSSEKVVTKAGFAKTCKSYKYKDVARNPEAYKNKRAKFTGKVIQVLEDDPFIELRVDVTKNKYGNYEDTVYVDYIRKADDEPRILEDDIITMYGTLDGLKKYTSVLGAEINIPMFHASFIDINE